MAESEERTFMWAPARRLFNRFGARFRSAGDDARKFDAVKELKEEIGFANLNELHTTIKKAEKKMQQVDEIRSKIAEVWTELSYFTNAEMLQKEIELIKRGTGLSTVSRQMRGGSSLNVPVLGTLSISPNPEMSYTVSYAGSDSLYWKALKQSILDQLGALEGSGKVNAEYLQFAKEKGEALLTKVEETVNECEKDVRNSLGEGREQRTKELLGALEEYEKNLVSLCLTPNEVEYSHTYRVVKKLSDQEKNELLSGRYGNWRATTEEERAQIGLDENGWPLEVDKEGKILIDVFRRNGNRQVPREWVVSCNAVDIANWLYSEYDAYISDLRDGRWHHRSTTAFDYIMTDLGVTYLNHRNSVANLRRGGQARVKIPLHVGGYKEMDMAPTHLNPAFDFEGRGKIPRHKGRLYYYDSQDYCEQSDERMISSRGAALYIVHKCIAGTKYVEGQGASKGVFDAIELISSETGGLDLGPNIGTFAGKYNNPFGQN